MPNPPTPDPRDADVDSATGCADDQQYASLSPESIRQVLRTQADPRDTDTARRIVEEIVGPEYPRTREHGTDKVVEALSSARREGYRRMWRVGMRVPVNIYKDDSIVGQCQSPELAAEIVSQMNAGADLLMEFHKLRPKADCYDRVCQSLEIKNDILGYVYGLRKRLSDAERELQELRAEKNA